MGNICMEFFRSKPTSKIRSVIQQQPALHPSIHTANDSRFLYFPQYFELETDIAHAIDKGKNLEASKSKLSSYLRLLNEYTDNNKQLESKLSRVQKEIQELHQSCYICLQIQQVQLTHPVKTLNVSIHTSQGVQLKTMTKQRVEKGHLFQLGLCIDAYVSPDSYLVIKVQDLVATLQVKQISKELAMLDVINLRKEGSLSPLGEMSIRAECLSTISTWKMNNGKLLNNRRKQIQKLLQIQDQAKLESSAKVFLVSSLSERGLSRMSYYREDQPGQVYFYM